MSGKYFNPLNEQNELYGFDLQTIDVYQYTHWLDGRLPQTLDNDCFIDFEKYTVQFIKVIFLCVLKDDSGLYLGLNFKLYQTPYLWYYLLDKRHEHNDKLYIPNHFHPYYFSLSFTNQTKQALDFYKINGYVRYNPSNKLIDFLEFFRLIDKIHPVTHLLKNFKKDEYDCNTIVQKQGNINLWLDSINLIEFQAKPGSDYFSIDYNYEPTTSYDYLQGKMILLCSTDDIYLEYSHKKILRKHLKSQDKF
jgi:hypothetical protein